MKKTFTDEQIVGILRGFEASGQTIKEYCRQKQVSEGTFYKRRCDDHHQSGQPNTRD